MLTITVGTIEYFNEAINRVEYRGGTVLEFEHSLVSLSKWEQKHRKPFLGRDEKTTEEILSYVECMLLTPDVSPDTLKSLTEDDYKTIIEYLNHPMTATWFRDDGPPPQNTQIITSELIYYWMSAAQLTPSTYETWHLNRLFTLLKVVAAHNEDPKKRKKTNPQDAAAQRRELNRRRMEAEGHNG